MAPFGLAITPSVVNSSSRSPWLPVFKHTRAKPGCVDSDRSLPAHVAARGSLVSTDSERCPSAASPEFS